MQQLCSKIHPLQWLGEELCVQVEEDNTLSLDTFAIAIWKDGAIALVTF